MTHAPGRAFGFLVVLLVVSGCSRRDEAPASRPATSPEKAASADRLEPVKGGAMTRLHEVDGVYLGSQPSAADLDELKKAGVKTVINLRHERELDFDESAVVAKLGMTYVHIPWQGPGELTDAVFDRGREVLASAERPLLLHCAASNRVGAIWLAYRVLDGGASFDAALEEAKAVGLKTPEFAEKARDYVGRRQGAK